MSRNEHARCCLALGPAASGRHGPVGVGPKESSEDHQGMEHLFYKEAERVRIG